MQPRPIPGLIKEKPMEFFANLAPFEETVYSWSQNIKTTSLLTTGVSRHPLLLAVCHSILYTVTKWLNCVSDCNVNSILTVYILSATSLVLW